MIPITQTKLHTEEFNGNCMRACLASLFEVDIDEIKPFENYFNDADDTIWVNIFLNEIDRLGYIYDGWCKLKDIGDYKGIDGYFMIGGESPRIFSTNNIGHSVIWKDGKIVHDPHPDNTGLKTIEEVYLIQRK